MGTSLVLDRKLESVAGSILVVDDDAELCRLVSRFLGAEGYSVQTVQSSGLGVERALSGSYDLVVLDVMLPEMDGFEVLRRIRVKSSTPILMLTARGDDLDRILGLEIGADDYLPKPFNTRELSARIRAILRRANSTNINVASSEAASMRVGDLELNAGARTVRCGGEALNLTTVEFDLLQRLLRSAGSVVGREELTKMCSGESSRRLTEASTPTSGTFAGKWETPWMAAKESRVFVASDISMPYPIGPEASNRNAKSVPEDISLVLDDISDCCCDAGCGNSDHSLE